MDDIIRDAIQSIISERTGVESMSELELLPDEASNEVLAAQELIDLAKLFALAEDDIFDNHLNQASPLVQQLWEEVISHLE